MTDFSCHPWLPLVATSSGQRHTALLSWSDGSDSDSECDSPAPSQIRENAVKLWWVGPTPPPANPTDDFLSETPNDGASIWTRWTPAIQLMGLSPPPTPSSPSSPSCQLFFLKWLSSPSRVRTDIEWENLLYLLERIMQSETRCDPLCLNCNRWGLTLNFVWMRSCFLLHNVCCMDHYANDTSSHSPDNERSNIIPHLILFSFFFKWLNKSS